MLEGTKSCYKSVIDRHLSHTATAWQTSIYKTAAPYRVAHVGTRQLYNYKKRPCVIQGRIGVCQSTAIHLIQTTYLTNVEGSRILSWVGGKVPLVHAQNIQKMFGNKMGTPQPLLFPQIGDC